jgi:hypothetical protein
MVQSENLNEEEVRRWIDGPAMLCGKKIVVWVVADGTGEVLVGDKN